MKTHLQLQNLFFQNSAKTKISEDELLVFGFPVALIAPPCFWPPGATEGSTAGLCGPRNPMDLQCASVLCPLVSAPVSGECVVCVCACLCVVCVLVCLCVGAVFAKASTNSMSSSRHKQHEQQQQQTPTAAVRSAASTSTGSSRHKPFSICSHSGVVWCDLSALYWQQCHMRSIAWMKQQTFAVSL